MTPSTLAPKPPRQQRAQRVTEVVLYVRVSTVQQADHGVSLAAQESELRRFAEQRWPDTPIVVEREEGKSAKAGSTRPAYARVLERAAKGGRVVVAAKPDRLARSVTEYLELIKLCSESGTELHTLTTGQVQTDSAIGKLTATILSAIAEFENDLKSERVRDAVTYLRDNGKSHGPIPFGLHRATGGIRERGEHFPAVLASFQLIDSGTSVKRATRTLSETTGTKITEARLRERILRNPIYAGLTEREGQLVTTHEPFVAPDLWHRVQAILDTNAAKNAKHPRRNPFGSLVRCGKCDGRMEMHSNGGYAVLRCENRRKKQCDAATIPTENFEIAVLSALSGTYSALRHSLDDPTWTWHIADPEAQRDRRDRLADVTIEIADLEGRADRLYLAYEEGAIEHDKYLARAQELRERRSALEAIRADLSRNETSHRADLEALAAILAGPYGDIAIPGLAPFAVWQDATFEQRVELLRAVLRTITVEHDAYVSVSFRAGPVLTYGAPARRNSRSATYRRLGYGLWGKNTRAPP